MNSPPSLLPSMGTFTSQCTSPHVKFYVGEENYTGRVGTIFEDPEINPCQTPPMSLASMCQRIREGNRIPCRTLELSFFYGLPFLGEVDTAQAAHLIASAMKNGTKAHASTLKIVFRRSSWYQPARRDEDEFYATLIDEIKPTAVKLILVDYPGNMPLTMFAIRKRMNNLVDIEFDNGYPLRINGVLTAREGFGLTDNDIDSITTLIHDNTFSIERLTLKNLIFSDSYHTMGAHSRWTPLKNAISGLPNLDRISISPRIFCVAPAKYQDNHPRNMVILFALRSPQVNSMLFGPKMTQAKLYYGEKNVKNLLDLSYQTWTRVMLLASNDLSHLYWMLRQGHDKLPFLFDSIEDRGIVLKDFERKPSLTLTRHASRTPYLFIHLRGSRAIICFAATRPRPGLRVICGPTFREIIKGAPLIGITNLEMKPRVWNSDIIASSFMNNASQTDFKLLKGLVRRMANLSATKFKISFTMCRSSSHIEDKRVAEILRLLPRDLKNITLCNVNRDIVRTISTIRRHFIGIKSLKVFGPDSNLDLLPGASKTMIYSLAKTAAKFSGSLETLHVHRLPIRDKRVTFFSGYCGKSTMSPSELMAPMIDLSYQNLVLKNASYRFLVCDEETIHWIPVQCVDERIDYGRRVDRAMQIYCPEGIYKANRKAIVLILASLQHDEHRISFLRHLATEAPNVLRDIPSAKTGKRKLDMNRDGDFDDLLGLPYLPDDRETPSPRKTSKRVRNDRHSSDTSTLKVAVPKMRQEQTVKQYPDFVKENVFTLVGETSFDATKFTTGIAPWDIRNKTKVAEQPEYVTDIFQRLYHSETNFMVSPHKLHRWDSFNPIKRAILVDWLTSVVDVTTMKTETLFLAINILDRYFSLNDITDKEAQKFGIASLMIASKIEEISAFELKDCRYVCDGAYSLQEIRNAEEKIVRDLDYKLMATTAYPFVQRFLTITEASKTQCEAAFFYAEATLHDIQFLEYRYSLIAAAAVVLAINNPSIRKHDEIHVQPPGVPQVLTKYSTFQEQRILRAARDICKNMAVVGTRKLKSENRILDSIKTRYKALATFDLPTTDWFQCS